MLIHKTKVRAYAKQCIADRKAKGGREFTRIHPSFFAAIEQVVKDAIRSRVHRAPSLGKTLH